MVLLRGEGQVDGPSPPDDAKLEPLEFDAKTLLVSLLDERQLEDWNRNRCFDVCSTGFPGRTYTVRYGYPVEIREPPRHTYSVCVVLPDWFEPSTIGTNFLRLVAIKLLLETNERLFLKIVGNQLLGRIGP